MNSTNYTKTTNQSISVTTVIHLSPTRVKYIGAAVLQLNHSITMHETKEVKPVIEVIKPCK